jgi:hypothetical protein
MPFLSRRLASGRVQPRAGVAMAEQDGELMLLDSARGAYYVLNPTAAAVWDALVESASGGGRGATVESLVDTIETRFAAPTASVRDDVLALLRDLRRAGLVRTI